MEVASKTQKVLKILESSKKMSDTEKLAALLLVTKVLKSNEISKEEELKIFQSINFSFLIKLLKTKHIIDGCSATCWKTISLSILKSSSVFYLDEEKSQELIPLLLEVLETSKDAENGASLVEDVCIIFSYMMRDALPWRRIYRQEIMLQLCAIVAHMSNGYDHSLTIIFAILASTDFQVLDASQDIIFMIDSLAIHFSDVKNTDVINVLEVVLKICSNLSMIRILELHPNGSFWKCILLTICNMLTSRIDVSFRQRVLLLSSKIINIFGFGWQELSHHVELVKILLPLTTIEMRMLLDEEVQINTSNLISLLEGLSSLMIDSIKFVQESKINNSINAFAGLDINTIQDIIFDSISTVVSYIKRVYNDLNNTTNIDFLNPCLCLLSAYISISEYALDEDIVDLVPVLIHAACNDLHIREKILPSKCIEYGRDANSTTDSTAVDAISCKPLVDETSCKPIVKDSSMLHLFLPGFAHLSHLAEVRAVFSQKDFILILFDHLKSCLANETSQRDTLNDISNIIDIFYNFTLSGDLMNLFEIAQVLNQYFDKQSETNNQITENTLHVLLLIISIAHQLSESDIKLLDLEKCFKTGTEILNKKNTSKVDVFYREDLKTNMMKCFSKFPQLANLLSQEDYTKLC